MAIRRLSGELVCPYAVGDNATFLNGINPNTLYKGTTWVQIKARVIAGYDSSNANFNSVGKTGGTSTHSHTTGSHTLTVAEIPSHKHMYAPSWIVASSGNTGIFGMEGESSNYSYGGGAGYSGGGQAHNHGSTGSASNLMPYIVKNLWERTA